MKSGLTRLPLLLLVLLIVACSEKKEDQTVDENSSQPTENVAVADNGKGIGPITEVDIPESINAELAAEGAEIFKIKCTACHKLDKRHVGPPLSGITSKRKPEWIMNMILNPDKMVKEDPAAKELMEEYLTPMTNQNITEEDARALLEYLRQADSEV